MLKTRQELTAMRDKLSQAYRAEKKKVIVCTGTGCLAAGADAVYKALLDEVERRGIDVALELRAEPSGGDTVGLRRSGCHGLCEMGPMIRIEPQGWVYMKVKPEDCADIIGKTVMGGEQIRHLLYEGSAHMARREDIPFFKEQTPVLLENCGRIDAESIDEYIATGGYTALERALFDMTPQEVVEEIKRSKLRGRGGGGFPAGRKWEQVARQPEGQKYVVCNGDEGDPGAFMDESVMEGDPHRMLEGMAIAGIAAGADTGYVYVRAEYPRAVARLRKAISQMEERGLLGDDILSSGKSFRILISRGAGAFVCGEGSALTASIEGKRGFPRVKPPRTVEHGLFDRPTVLNNVETFANVPIIIARGAEQYLKLGTEGSPGTKAFALTGNIAHTGLIEVPMGTTLRRIIYDIGGGLRGGGKFKAVQIGGPSGACLTEEHLDMPLDFDTLTKIGAMIGSGGLVVMDEHTCMVEVARFFMHFTQSESCGKCIPCREGTKRMLGILERIVAGEGEEGDVELLLELADTISVTALCGLGKSAPNPVVSTIRYFRDEYDAHIREKRCPAGACTKLRTIEIDPEKCKGCSRCMRVCPVAAISGEIGKMFVIDQSKCIKCGTCLGECPFGAIGQER